LTEPYATLDEFAAAEPGAQVYLCGPMSGYPECNFPAFREGARVLREEYGLRVYSPVEMDESDGFTATENVVDVSEVQYLEFLRRDVNAVLDTDTYALVVLPGWEKSRGASIETFISRSFNKPIYDLDTEALVKHPSDVKVPTHENIAEEAVRLVQPGGERHDQYGHPLTDFTRTAAIITAIIGHEVRADQIPLIMMAVKISRICQTPTKRDSWVDIIGYALTGEMALAKQDTPLA
jgi:hypothetical protein